MERAAIFDVVKKNVLLVVGDVAEGDIVETASLAELGADSLQIVEVVSRSMKQLDLKVKRTDLSDAKNLHDLLDLFERAAAAR